VSLVDDMTATLDPRPIHGVATTHVGCVRSNNQDSFCINPAAGVWAVADGMGGHNGGERASALIVAALEGLPERTVFPDKLATLRQAITSANRLIFDEAQINQKQMGSTVVALVIGEGRYAVVWAGDSRAYLNHDRRIECLTRDHSQAEELVAAGMLDRRDVTGHPSSHVLVRAVGVLPDVEVDVIQGQVANDDVFLLCSDGLYNLVSEAEMAGLIDNRGLDRASEQLVELGLERGAPDNITVCLVSVGHGDVIHDNISGNIQQ
jgi:serine/threonine protein phosphatase Stp1